MKLEFYEVYEKKYVDPPKKSPILPPTHKFYPPRGDGRPISGRQKTFLDYECLMSTLNLCKISGWSDDPKGIKKN
jgi:hypothetical protein